MTVLAPETVRLSLELGCCPDTDEGLLEQMSGGKYDECAVLPVPASLDEWRAAHKTARKRADRCYARGYVAAPLERERFADDIYHINISASHRQGRPMTGGYLKRSDYSPLPVYPCPRHAVRTTGVFAPDGSLVAYQVMLRQGDLALVSQILGHAAHEDREVMYLLFEHAIDREVRAGGMCVYNRWDSGTDGLRFFKERLGFEPRMVEWLP